MKNFDFSLLNEPDFKESSVRAFIIDLKSLDYESQWIEIHLPFGIS